MKSKVIVFLSVIAVLLLTVACTSGQNGKQDRQKSIEEYANRINEDPVALDKTKADSLIMMYSDYVKDYPEDTMSEYYLFQMSNVYSAMKECDKALDCLDKIIKDYPNGKKVGAAYFFKGVVLQDVCLNKEESIKAFELYIEKFPNSVHVHDAKKMIDFAKAKQPEDILGYDSFIAE